MHLWILYPSLSPLFFYRGGKKTKKKPRWTTTPIAPSQSQGKLWPVLELGSGPGRENPLLFSNPASLHPPPFLKPPFPPPKSHSHNLTTFARVYLGLGWVLGANVPPKTREKGYFQAWHGWAA